MMERHYSGSIRNNQNGPDVDVFVTDGVIRIGVHDGEKGVVLEITNDEAFKIGKMLHSARVVALWQKGQPDVQ